MFIKTKIVLQQWHFESQRVLHPEIVISLRVFSPKRQQKLCHANLLEDRDKENMNSKITFTESSSTGLAGPSHQSSESRILCHFTTCHALRAYPRIVYHEGVVNLQPRRTTNLVQLAMVVDAGREDDCSKATTPSSSSRAVVLTRCKDIMESFQNCLTSICSPWGDWIAELAKLCLCTHWSLDERTWSSSAAWMILLPGIKGDQGLWFRMPLIPS